MEAALAVLPVGTSTVGTAGWLERKPCGRQRCFVAQAFSRDVQNKPKRGTCLEDDDLGGGDKVWHPPQQASRTGASLLPVGDPRAARQRMLEKPG